MKVSKYIKIIFIGLIFIGLILSSLILRSPNDYAPYVYSFFSKLNFSQQDAKFVEKGVELETFKVGKIPTSVDITNYLGADIALVTSMGDSIISLVDLNAVSGQDYKQYKLANGSKPRVSIWCDIDNDDIDEIIVPLWGKGNSSVFIGVISETNEIIKKDEIIVGNRPRSVACGDLDNDGFNEIVTADNFSNTLSIIQNNGKLSYLKSIQVGNEPGAINVVDFNRDNKKDLVISHRASNNLYVLLQKDNFEFEIALVLPTLEAPKDQVVVDIDGDGFLDVITADGTSNNISIFYIKELKVVNIERIKVSGSPHALKYIKHTGYKTGSIVVAGYPNWVEVLSKCEGEYRLTESLWFGGAVGVLKRKVLYLDYFGESNFVYAVMAGIDSLVKLPVRLSKCE